MRCIGRGIVEQLMALGGAVAAGGSCAGHFEPPGPLTHRTREFSTTVNGVRRALECGRAMKQHWYTLGERPLPNTLDTGLMGAFMEEGGGCR